VIFFKCSARFFFFQPTCHIKRYLWYYGTSCRPKQFPPVVFLTESDRKRILVTGGAGFVGSHLVDTLMRDGHEVSVCMRVCVCVCVHEQLDHSIAS